MRRLICVFVFLGFFLTSCASVPVSNETISTVAMSATYGIYRAVPESRTPLILLCSFTEYDNPGLFREKVGELWLEINNTDMAMLVVTLNTFVALFEANLQGTKDVVPVVKAAVKGICAGVQQAGGVYVQKV
jgi:hypothetical protein